MILILSGCNQSDSSSLVRGEDICGSSSSELCELLHRDSLCESERVSFIKKDDARRNNENDLTIYELLLANESYNECMNQASMIEFVDAKTRFFGENDKHNNLVDNQRYEDYQNKLLLRKSQRLRAHFNAMNAFKETEEAGREMGGPYMYYWQWARHADGQAKRQLIKSYEEGRVTEYD